MRFYAPRLCRSQTDSPSLPTFYALSRRRATELFFLGAVMVFLVFSEVLEMSSEVVGPGPTHGRSNLSGLTWDLLLVPSRPMPDACYPLLCLFVVSVWGGFPPGVLPGFPELQILTTGAELPSGGGWTPA